MWYFACICPGVYTRLPRGRVVVVVGKRLRNRVHASVAADAVIEEYPAVAARRTAHVLADPIRRPRIS